MMLILFIIILSVLFFSIAHSKSKLRDSKEISLYDLKFYSIDGKLVRLNDYKCKVLLIVNVASFCGLTKQYSKLQALYDQFKDQGFEIIAFPCNQFRRQEPGTNLEIKTFCETKFNISFLIADKINVNGSSQHELYRYFNSLSNKKFNKKIFWNFTKFIVDKNGHVIARFGPLTTPSSKSIKTIIKNALG